MRRVAFVGAVLCVALTVGCGGPDSADEIASPSPAPQSQPPGGAMTTEAMCVETYSVENLKKRDFAFDGTVRRVADGAGEQPDTVTFDVTTWYKGGEGSSTTRKASGFTTPSSVGDAHRVGDRLLVAGDDDDVWQCGFTQPYSAAKSAEWDRAFE